MKRATQVFCDGTFDSRPASPQCAQILQISTVIRNAVRYKILFLFNFADPFELELAMLYLKLQVVPLVVVMMTGKTQEEYIAVLQYLQHLIPAFRPRQVMTDFEVGLQNAWKTVFPRCFVSGCYWHFCRVSLSLYLV